MVFGNDLLALTVDALHDYRNIHWRAALRVLNTSYRRALRRHKKKKDFNASLESFFALLQAHGLLFCGAANIKELVALIRRSIAKRGITLRELERLSTVSKATVCRMFKGSGHMQNVLAVCQALGIKIVISPYRPLRVIK